MGGVEIRIGLVTTRREFTEIVQWRSHEMPEALDALIVPEDTYLMLQAVTEELDPHVTPLDLWVSLERAARTEKHALGSVMITDGTERGVRFIARAIVYDFEAEPISREDIVRAALQNALHELVKRDCQAVGVFPLGTMPGGIAQDEYFAAVKTAAASLTARVPQRLYLLVPDAARAEDLDGGDASHQG